MLTFAIGDIHGCLAPLTRLLAKCRRYTNGRPARFIFLGDYIDRGPDSRGVVELIIAMQAADPDGVIALVGNHEDFLHRLDRPADVALWLANGGEETLASYGATSVEDLPSDHLVWMQALPTHFDDGQRFFVHAGIRPGVPLNRQSREDMLWIRKIFLESDIDHGRFIVHGHTPTESRQPDIQHNRLNIDTGCVFYGGPLTAAVFTKEKEEAIDFISSR